MNTLKNTIKTNINSALNTGKNKMISSLSQRITALRASGPLLMIPALILSGCWMNSTKVSPQGGIVPTHEEFSITVPKSYTIKQGSSVTAYLTVNRDSYFKQDVQLELKTEGISVTPSQIMVKASDRPEAQVQVVVPKDAALGEYKVFVKGSPVTGNSTKSEFTVTVIHE